MGSQIGLKHLILENFPEKTVYMVGDEPGYLSFMEDSVMDEISDETYNGALALILDCGAAHLVSDERYTLAARTARMDHHLYVGCFTDAEAIDSSFESCCGLIAQMARTAGWKLNRIAAKSLFTGMVTDSGRFRYDSTTARTFELAAFLMSQPIDTEALYKELYADDFENKRRKAEFLLKTQFTDNRVASIYTTAEELADLKMSTFSVSRGMVNTMADIRGTDVWVNFTEADGGVLCELRSSGPNINPIAVKYGGGGHAKASGAKVPDRATAMRMLEDLNKLTGETK
jgi:phosphoesterase RecJ-like protein